MSESIPPIQVFAYGDLLTRAPYPGGATYEGGAIPYVDFNFVQKPVYDTDGRTVLYFDCRYEFIGVLYETVNGKFPEEIDALARQLGAPRQRLRVGWVTQADTLSPLPASPAVTWMVDTGDRSPIALAFDSALNARTPDINWGPCPGEFHCEQIPGGRVARYRWSVVVHRIPCENTDGTTGNTAIPDAWEGVTFATSTSVDQDGYTHRTVSGKITLSSYALPAETYRLSVEAWFPIPSTSWRRLMQQFEVSEDGRVLSFAIRDQEIQFALPAPATTGQASYSLTTGMPMSGGGMTYGFWRFALRGMFRCGKNGTKAQLRAAVLALARKKIPGWDDALLGTYVSPTGTKKWICLENVSFDESVYANEITFSISGIMPWASESVRVPVVGNITVVQGNDWPGFGTDPPTEAAPAVPPANGYGADDKTGESTLIKYTRPTTPCESDLGWDSGTTSVGSPNTSSTSSASGTPTFFGSSPGEDAGGQTGTDAAPPTPTPSPALSDEQTEAPYIAYNEVISYEYDSGIRVTMPLYAGTAPFAQQAQPESLIVCQSGYAIRYGTIDGSGRPEAPAPILGEAERIMLKYSVTPEVPQPMTSSTIQYKVSWYYLMQYASALPDTDFAPDWPGDPRLAETMLSEDDSIAVFPTADSADVA